MATRSMTRGLALLAALLVAALLLATTASAPLTASAAASRAPSKTPAWGSMQVVSRNLFNPLVTAGPDGGVWGIGRVGGGPTSHMAVLHRPPGGAWTARGLPVIGMPLAVADDGRTTFVLYATWTGCGIACQIRILNVPHGGAPSTSRLLDRTDGGIEGASLIARDGQWWAVWSGAVKKVPNPRSEGDWSYYVHEARTLGTSYGTRTVLSGGPEVRTAWPQLVFRGRYQVLLKVDRPEHIEFWSAGLPGGALRRTPYRIASDGNAAVMRSVITTSGTRTIVAFNRQRGAQLIVAHDDADLRFTHRTMPVRGGGGPRLAVSLGRLFVSFGACTSLMDCRGYVATGALTGGFSITEVTAPLVAPGQTDLRFGITGLTATRGKATVLFSAGSSVLYARSQR